MARTKIATAAVLAAATGAFSTAAFVSTAHAESVKCYGIAKAGENDCANHAGTHSCAAQSTVDYSYDDWKLADEEDCLAQGGQLEGSQGFNEQLLET